MRRYNPYRNIFYYYRGPSSNQPEFTERQIENNLTKSFINVLEYCEPDLLLSLIEYLGLRADMEKEVAVMFDLQLYGENSIPDACIKIGKTCIYIESKLSAPLDMEQIHNHLTIDDISYLIVITPRSEDKNTIKNAGIKKVIFVTWQEIFRRMAIYGTTCKTEKTKFIISQFLDYMEKNHIAPFTGWRMNDFESFLHIAEDPDRELRLQVNDKLYFYISDLQSLIKHDPLYRDMEYTVGNIRSDSVLAWGILCRPPLREKVHIPHFNFWIDSNEFGMGVQIESKNASYGFLKKASNNKHELISILRSLNKYNFVIRERINLSGKPRDYHGVERVRIQLGNTHFSDNDLNYILSKSQSYHLPEFHCRRVFQRDDPMLDNNFLETSVECLDKLKPFYSFCNPD